LEKLNNAVIGKPNDDTECVVSPIVQNIMAAIEQTSKWIDEIPPIAQRGRFANPAFKTWFDKMVENSDVLMRQILPPEYHDAVIELSGYWQISWGDRSRCDYGSGHEMNFVAWVYCLDLMGVVKPADYTALVIKVFRFYIETMRKLQMRYMLEPAGSKGVWTLDDYQFLVFYFGAAQIRGHAHIKPSSILMEDVYETYHQKYMFLGAVRYITQVKKGPFFEHSPTLYNISDTVKLWEKVNEGLMKMYKAEVLCKFPVMQHFKFGSLIAFNP